VSNNIQVIADRTLDAFVMTGEVMDVLSPEYDMRSRIEVKFSHAIFTDTGSLFSEEYIANRSAQKKKLLEHLFVSPDIGLTESNIALTPDKVSIIGNFQEKVAYRISLDGVEDIYGRSAGTQLSFTPDKKPFLSLVVQDGKTVFPVGSPIAAKIFSLSTPKDHYSVKLCQIPLQDYARMERVITEGKIEHTDAVYELLNSDRTSACVKKDITLTPGASVTPFSVNDLVEGGKLAPGLYILAFRDRDDILPFGRFVAPKVFSVIDEQIAMKVDSSGRMQFLVTDILTNEPKPNQSIEILENVGATSEYAWNPTTQTYEQRYLPLSTQAFSTGMTVATTNKTGIAQARIDTTSSLQMMRSPYSLMNEYSYDDSSYPSFVAISRG